MSVVERTLLRYRRVVCLMRYDRPRGLMLWHMECLPLYKGNVRSRVQVVRV